MKKRTISRRSFVQISTAAGFGLSGCSSNETPLVREETGAQVPVSTPYGAQLYTLRNVLPQDPEGVLKAVAELGYSKAEVLRTGLEEIAPILERYKLSAVAGHFEAPLVTGNYEPWKESLGEPDPNYDWNAAVQQALEVGLEYMVIAYLQPSERGDLDFYREFADKMNAAAEVCRSAGLKGLCYHNHAFEFGPLEGSSPFEVLMNRFDMGVGVELDIFWSSVAGVDPVSVFESFPGRVPLVHLKDKAENTPIVYSEQEVPVESFLEVGSGVLDIPAVLSAAEKAGSEHLFVEQDHCPGDPLASLKKSIDYLQSV